MKELGSKHRRIPPINSLVNRICEHLHPAICPHDFAVSLARQFAHQLRTQPGLEDSSAQLDVFLQPLLAPGPRQVLNGTGIFLHTNLGRAPLSADVLHRAFDEVFGYTNLETDLSSGKRGHRDRTFQRLAQQLWGVEDATLVNNAAAAVNLSITALAAGKETIVSRGELIEIGGSFRMPDIMAFAGTRLVEVGTTNKTRIRDYASAITPFTGCLFKAHPSNYAIQGFTQAATLPELVALGKENNLPVIMDLGSGYSSFAPLPQLEEPTIEEAVKAEADVIIFSGDKLLAGVQAGLVLGTQKAITAMRKHTMMRMVRVDKLTHAITCHQLRALALGNPMPFHQLVSTPPEQLRLRAQTLVDQLANMHLTVVASTSQMGGGSLPGTERPSYSLAYRGPHAQQLADKARLASPPLIGYLQNEMFFVNLATLFPHQDQDLLTLMRNLLPQA